MWNSGITHSVPRCVHRSQFGAPSSRLHLIFDLRQLTCEPCQLPSCLQTWWRCEGDMVYVRQAACLLLFMPWKSVPTQFCSHATFWSVNVDCSVRSLIGWCWCCATRSSRSRKSGVRSWGRRLRTRSGLVCSPRRESVFVHPHTESMDGCKLDHRQSLPRSAHESSAAGASERDPATSCGRERRRPPRMHSFKTRLRCSQFESER
jgi:hypothetical protein